MDRYRRPKYPSFLKSSVAPKAITELLDESDGIPSIDKINAFVEAAIQNGLDKSGAAQFASILLSAKLPGNFVDFRNKHWNILFEFIAGDKEQLCHGGTYGWKLERAGDFASRLSETPTFERYFGKDNGPWKVAGLAWKYKDGIPIIKIIKPPSADIPLNLILYGPPGTGKTYYLNEELSKQFLSTDSVRTKKAFLEDLVAGISWWQVVALVLLDLGSAKVAQIYNHEILRAKDSIMAQKKLSGNDLGHAADPHRRRLSAREIH